MRNIHRRRIIKTNSYLWWDCNSCEKRLLNFVYANSHRSHERFCEDCFEKYITDKVDEAIQLNTAEDQKWGIEYDHEADRQMWEVGIAEPWVIMEKEIDYSLQPQASGFIIIHTRATDRVFFGPFATVEEASEWLDTVGRRNGVSGGIDYLMNPHGDPQDFWWIPDNVHPSETIKPKQERQAY